MMEEAVEAEGGGVQWQAGSQMEVAKAAPLWP